MTDPPTKGLSQIGQSISAAKNDPIINRLERELVNRFPVVEVPVIHRFTPGMYSREVFMPKGAIITSKIHKTEHHFVVLSGRCKVLVDGDVVELTAGHVGITKPGTRRVLVIFEDSRWITFHPTTLTDLAEIEAMLIEPHDIPQNNKRVLE